MSATLPDLVESAAAAASTLPSEALGTSSFSSTSTSTSSATENVADSHADAKSFVTIAVTLEPMAPSHADEMFSILSDPAAYTFLDNPPFASMEEVNKWLTRLESRRSPDGTQQWLNWVVRTKEGEAAGYVQATVMQDRTATLGYLLGSRYWGRGLAYAAMAMMLPILTNDFSVSHFRAEVDRRNERSIHLLKKFGFELDEKPAEAPGDVAYCKRSRISTKQSVPLASQTDGERAS